MVKYYTQVSGGGFEIGSLRADGGIQFRDEFVGFCLFLIEGS